MTQEEYFAAPGVSNSAMNALHRELYPQSRIILSDNAFRFGKLFEGRVQLMPKQYSELFIELGEAGDREQIERMYMALIREQWALTVMNTFRTQVPFFNEITFKYNGIAFKMKVKALFDWFLEGFGGGDLKTYSGNFDAACHRFGWTDSRVFYMLVANTKKDFIIGVSKDKRPKVSIKYIHYGTPEFVASYNEISRKLYDYYMLKY